MFDEGYRFMDDTAKQIYNSFPQELKRFWCDTALHVPNAYMLLQTMDFHKESTGTDRTKTHYAFTQVIPLPRGTKTTQGVIERDFAAIVFVSKPLNITDTAHEIAHHFLHGVLHYPYVWDHSDERIENINLNIKRTLAQRIYDIAVHPTIDHVLQQRGLLFPGFYERMYSDFKRELKTWGNTTSFDGSLVSYDKVIRFIEFQQRLPEKYQRKIFAQFSGKQFFDTFLDTVKRFPQFNVDILEPETVSEFVRKAWNYLDLDSNKLFLELDDTSPLINPK